MILSPGTATITACVIARDAAGDLSELLPSLRWADEVSVLVDDTTRDHSISVARAHSDRVEVVPFLSFPSIRNRGLGLASSRWVFFVDADERISPALAAEARMVAIASEQALATGASDAPVGYWVPRDNIVFGRVIRGGGWSPDYQLRLLRRGSARYDEARLVHELVHLNGADGHLTERLLHHNYTSRAQFAAKQRRYTVLEAESLRSQGVSYRRRALLGLPLREFLNRYVTLRGWVDGSIGFYLSAAMAYYAYERVRLVRGAPSASPAASQPG